MRPGVFHRQRYSAALLESALGKQDKELRDKFYNGFLGTYYQHVMPFLSLPVRPAKSSWKGWLVYFVIIFFLLSLVAYLINLLLDQNSGHSIAQTVVALLSFLAICFFFFKHPYLF